MHRLPSVLVGLLAIPAFVSAAAITGAAPAGGPVTVTFNNMVLFGDSLSDVGNMYQATGTPQSPPYAAGRASNGPVWAEHLSQSLGLPAPTHSLAGGNNYAWFGAQTGSGMSSIFNTPNLQTQVATYLTGHTPSANTLYVLWAGPNDFLSGTAYTTYAGNVAGAVGTLRAAGARQFLVLNLPPLGLTPQFGTDPLARTTANLLSQGFNTALATGLNTLDTADTNIMLFDVYEAFNQMTTNPSAYGFANVTQSALNSGNDPDEYLFWDSFHPTTAGHRALANAIPEPACMVILVVSSLLLIRRNPAK